MRLSKSGGGCGTGDAGEKATPLSGGLSRLLHSQTHLDDLTSDRQKRIKPGFFKC